jgi:hypothetical protein
MAGGQSGNRTAAVYVSTAQRSRLNPLTPAGDDYQESTTPELDLSSTGCKYSPNAPFDTLYTLLVLMFIYCRKKNTPYEPISLQTTITLKWLAFRPRTRIREFPINIPVRGLVTSAVALGSFLSPSVQTRRRQFKLSQNRFLSHSL